MAKGIKTGGRKKGVPNKLTSSAKEAFLLTFQRLAPDLEEWIRLAANDDPGKAADLTIRLAEYHYPKLGRTEVTGDGGGSLVIKVVKLDGDQGDHASE